MKGNLKVVLAGRGPLVLRESNYVTSGGEGSVYHAEQTVVKIYADPGKMARDSMPEKIAALAAIKHPAIAGPAGVVTDEKTGAPLGFYMPFVAGEPMPRVFTADFRARTGFDDAAARATTAVMRTAVTCAHDAGAVMIDANEFNWIVGDDGPHVIDVNSWAIGRWPATVIMPSIRDWQAKTFDAASDWFSWGVVAFQVFTGIHPFKGRLDGYKPGELERRMRDNASVFAPGVRLPASARDPSCIPGPLLEWFRAEFQDGVRTAPPSPLDRTKTAAPAVVLRATAGHGSGLVHERLLSRPGDAAVRAWPCGLAALASGTLVDMANGATVGLIRSADDTEIVRAGHGWIVAEMQGGRPVFSFADGRMFAPIDIGLALRGLFRSGNRLFGITDRDLVELELSEKTRSLLGVIPADPAVMITNRWGARPNAMRWFDGVAVQDVLGSAFLMMPTSGHGMAQVKAPDLDGLVPIAGVGLGRFAAVVASDRLGAYHRVEFTFGDGMEVRSVWKGHNDGPDMNMTVLPRGVVATIVDDGEIVIFVPSNGGISKVKDRRVATDFRLARWDDRVICIRDGDVWGMRVK